MIGLSSEAVLSLADAAALLPRKRGRKIHVATVYRWTTTGCRGVVLESIQIGGARCTSREALQRFVDRLTALSLGVTDDGATNKVRQSADEVAAELNRLGI